MMTTPKKRMPLVSVLLVSLCTLLSRALGFVRELSFVRCLGARMISDAFLTALRIPNTFYEICAGGACGPAILPQFIHVKRTEGILATNRLLTLLLSIMLVIMSIICCIIAQFPYYVLAFVVPGFSPEQLELTVALLRIFLIFMWMNTGTAILAEALRAERYFFIPSLGQVIINIVFIAGLLAYAWWKTSITTLAYCVVAGGVLQFCMHVVACWYVGCRPALPYKTTWNNTATILKRFVPCMLTSGINEIALFIELQFASYLPVGSISLMTYASSIMRLPFGILIHPLITVILPELTKLQSYASGRISFLIYEILKVIVWILGPLVLLLAWFSHDIFVSLYGSSLTTSALITLQNLLLIKLCGLIFLSINHVCLQVFYVRHEIQVPTMVSLATSAWSIVATYFLYPRYGIYGIAASGAVTTIVRTLLFMNLLNIRINISRYTSRFGMFFGKIVLQWIICMVPWLWLIAFIQRTLETSTVTSMTWYAHGIGLWLWVAPSTLLLAGLLWGTRKIFGLKFYIVD